MISRNVSHRAVDGKRLHGFVCSPDLNRPRPVIVILHEIWGLDAHIKDVTCRFTQQGYVGFAVDLFSRLSTRLAATLEEGFQLRDQLSDAQVLTDVDSAVEYLKTQSFVDPKALAVLGFCMGGRYALLYACHAEMLKAALVFYGRLRNSHIDDRTPRHPLDLIPYLSCPILALFGEEDPGIPIEQVNEFRERLQFQGKKFQIRTYPGAPHAFFNDTKPTYREEAAKDAWKQTLRFLRRYLPISPAA